MIDHAIYFIMQTLGYRLFHYDMAFARNINLDSFTGWNWRPDLKKGTYRERRDGYKFCGYGCWL